MGPQYGGWRMLTNLTGEHVVIAAKLAIEERNRLNDLNLSSVSVLSGCEHMVEVREGDAANQIRKYVVDVSFRAWLKGPERCILNSFKPQVIIGIPTISEEQHLPLLRIYRQLVKNNTRLRN